MTAFADKYGRRILNTPAYCQCGQIDSHDHTLTRPNRGYLVMRHNDGIKDLEGEFIKDTSKDAKIEPDLQPVGELHLTCASHINMDLKRNIRTP